MTDAYGILTVLALFVCGTQIVELIAVRAKEFEVLEIGGSLIMVLTVALAISMFICWLSPRSVLVELDQQEAGIIERYRAEQTVIKAQQELQKLKQKGDNDGHDQDSDGQRRLP